MGNEKLKAIAVDDEQHCLDTLLWEIERHCPKVEVVKSFLDPEQAYKELKKTNIDILFLDIHLQSTSGIELLQRLQPVDYHVIFVTAYDEYAIKAFELAATDYLLKPINGKRLKETIDRIHMINEPSQDLKNLIDKLMSEANNVKKIALPILSGFEFVSPDLILYIEGDNNYSIFHFKNGSKLVISKTLSYIENLVKTYSFLRVHKSYIINVKYIVRYFKRSGATVVLENGKEIPVSRTRKDALNEFLA